MPLALVATRGQRNVDKISSEEREEAYKTLDPKLHEIYKEAEILLNKESECVIRARYEIGLIVTEVYETWGSKTVDKLSTALGRNKNILYKAKAFVEVFSEDDLYKLLEMKNENGLPLNWSHIEALLVNMTDDLREQLLDKTLNENWTSTELAKKITEALNGPRGNSSGRPFTKPKNFDGYLDSIITTADVWTKKAEQVWLGGDKTLQDVASEIEELNDKTLGKLQDALDRINDTVYAAQQTSKELNEVREELVTRLNSNAKIRVLEPTKDKEDDEDEEDDKTPEPEVVVLPEPVKEEIPEPVLPVRKRRGRPSAAK